jgi:2-polyprenyl-3-methyl-5-hydroxy-6-metoxy-1,4-benzoquinol methylase
MQKELKNFAKRIGKGLNARRLLTNRTSACIPVAYNYRATAEGCVSYKFACSGKRFSYQLTSGNAAANGKKQVPAYLVRCNIPDIAEGDVLSINLLDLTVTHNGTQLSHESKTPPKSRKFSAQLKLSCEDGIRVRNCGHYLPFKDKTIAKDYYFGDDYTDYPNETFPDHAVDLVRRFAKTGRLLDVGCALGIYAKAFLDKGFDSFAIDSSAYAVKEAEKLLGPSRAAISQLSADDIPFSGTFDVIWCWDVLEHFAAPKAALSILSKRASAGAFMFLHTSNADSLSHRLFGSDWEGYSDYSHYGIDQITNDSLQAWLTELGWEVLEWRCTDLWIRGPDEIFAHLRNIFHGDEELRTFVRERGLGDFIFTVARRKSCP